MKRFLKRVAFRKLRYFAQKRLGKMHARVIGITGSIGKTTTKEAVAHVLSRRYKVLKSDKSYNTEFGLPMTILEVESPGSSLLGWIKLFCVAGMRAFFSREKYDFVVLEMGVDKPRDMDQLLTIVQPDIAVFTGVAPVHMAEGQFESLDDIYQEKSKILQALPKDGMAFINYDFELLRTAKTDAKVVFYGTHEGAKLRASQVEMTWNGIEFYVQYGNLHAGFSVPVLGKHHVSAFLPAIGVALMSGMFMDDVQAAMRSFLLPPGRLNFIAGIRDSVILDSSYNASPDAVKSALQTLDDLASEKARSIFVFGNMNELGKFSEQAHRDLAHAMKKIDVLITVGDQAKFMAEEVLKKKILPPNAVHSFDDVMAARDFVKGIIQEKDVILVKGSQNKVRLEKLVKYIMAEPERARDLLVRQNGIWEQNSKS